MTRPIASPAHSHLRNVIDDVVDAAIKGHPVCVPAAMDWPFIYIDDAADAVVSACFSKRRKQLTYFIAYPEHVSLVDLATATSLAGRPVQLEIDSTNPPLARGPLDITAAQRDFGFSPKIDHREGVRRKVVARSMTLV